MDKFCRRVWIPVGFFDLLISLLRWGGRPTRLASVPNPVGTLSARVCRHDGLLSIGATRYVISVKPVTFPWLAPFTPETEVVVLDDACFHDQEGSRVTWQAADRLVVKATASRAFVA